MNKIEPIGIGGLHRGLTIPEIYIENTNLHDEVNGLQKQRRKAREKIKKLQQENQQLKKQKESNWNNLREYITQLKNGYMEIDNIFDDAKFRILLTILDKMNELESGDK